ncbi:inhibitor of growth protein 1 [Eupeodes corollae]|uniref:inhibitor of growth protein 1 n=1 Tax=Eupeodes corollae TaxID=290404 RepID=UPI00248FFDBE|nr:inhibitor of growth protein 1 [Eupeodes corollae]
MINPVASEAIFSATYVDNYIDSVENLPDDVQRHLSRIRDIDVQYRSHLRDVDYYYVQWKSFTTSSENSTNRRARAMARMQQSLISAQELGDEKMQIVNQLQELIDQKTRQLDSDQKNLDYGKEEQLMHDLPQKVTRTLSPVPLQATIPSANKNESAFVNAIISSGLVAGGQGSGSNTPTSSLQAPDRAITNHGVGVSNMSNCNDSRSNKRSRRPRNENNNSSSAMELGGNESNSANEGGGPTGHKSSATGQSSSSGASASQKKSSGQNAGAGGGGAGGGTNSSNSKKKKRKARGQSSSQANARDNREDTPPPDPIDPDEPTYCLCDQISFGEMILCDNDLCPIEWFHFSCVSLVSKPKGKWYCPNCRGDRPNIMKPKAQFLKELERYNKEKEEKT